MTRTISLTQGKVAIIDAADFERINQWKWHAVFKKHRDTWCAARTVRNGKKCRTVLMHRVILVAPDGMDVDHRDGDGLNNRRSNIRVATKQQNNFNKAIQRNSSSGRKGVSWNASCSKWHAYISVNRRKIYLGLFIDKEDAAKAYEDAAKAFAGEFTRTHPFEGRAAQI